MGDYERQLLDPLNLQMRYHEANMRALRDAKYEYNKCAKCDRLWGDHIAAQYLKKYPEQYRNACRFVARTTK